MNEKFTIKYSNTDIECNIIHKNKLIQEEYRNYTHNEGLTYILLKLDAGTRLDILDSLLYEMEKIEISRCYYTTTYSHEGVTQYSNLTIFTNSLNDLKTLRKFILKLKVKG